MRTSPLRERGLRETLPHASLLIERYTLLYADWLTHSVVCLLADTRQGRPLFPGADYVKQLEYIINYVVLSLLALLVQ